MIAAGEWGREHACPSCWARLPEHLRRAVATARRKSRAYSVALHDAHPWLAEDRREGGIMTRSEYVIMLFGGDDVTVFRIDLEPADAALLRRLSRIPRG